MGGARNVGIKSSTTEKFEKVESLLRDEPSLGIAHVLERFNLPISTYYRLKNKYDTKKRDEVRPKVSAINLENIADGIANDLFIAEMKKIAQNVADLKTKAEAKRTITMTFEFIPSDDRDELQVFVTAESKLATTKNPLRSVWCGEIDGEPVIVDRSTKQMSLFEQGEVDA